MVRTIVFFCIALSQFAHADPPALKPAQSFVEVLNGKPVTSKVTSHRISTAKILIADYKLIQKDFPQTAQMTPAQIDEWLLNQGGYLSKGQIDNGIKAGVNSKIAFDPKNTKMALRPPQYDRALVFEAEGGGLLDGKGFGANLPRLDSHANGLMETYQSVREYLYTKATREIFAHADAPYNVVDAYAVIDWGFDVNEYGVNGKTHRAGAILRQAHVRDLTSDLTAQGQLSRQNTEAVERIIRNYGMTSGKIRLLEPGVGVDTLNIQGTKDGHFIYDYGSFQVRERFSHPAVMLTDYALAEKEMKKDLSKFVVFDPESPLYPEPDDRLRLEVSKWTGPSRSEEMIRRKIKSITEELGRTKTLADVRAELHILVKEYVTMPAAQWRKFENTHIHVDGCKRILKAIFPN